MRLIDADKLKEYLKDMKASAIKTEIELIMQDMIDKFFPKVIDEQPTANEWIPVSERLPSSDGRFEVTIKGSKGKRYTEMCNFHKDATIYKWGGKWSKANVIAWKERSQPYKEETK